ncbi:MAG: FAD:protein FMN transferase, partial [Gammaproteobacteria bacterium]|nr:FAD:protein FMN transferase [Gammaproteobacteria bacterium]
KKSGWNKIRWDNPRLRLLQGMKLNFNAINKEHAADRCMALASEITSIPIMLNIGGNIFANKPRSSTNDWLVKIPISQSEIQTHQIVAGGIATASIHSEHQYFDGRNCQSISSSHGAITVASDSCTKAGILATLAMLYGDDAEAFLTKQQTKYWIHY